MAKHVKFGDSWTDSLELLLDEEVGEESNTRHVDLRQLEALRSGGEVSAQEIPVIIILAGTLSGKIFKLDLEQLLLGRSKDADFSLRGEGISRFHAKITTAINATTGIREAWIEDLESKNGTFINGHSIKKKVQLYDGDILTLGSASILKFRYLDPSFVETMLRMSPEEERAGVVQVDSERGVLWLNNYAMRQLGISKKQTSKELYAYFLEKNLIKPPSWFQEGRKTVASWKTKVGFLTYECRSMPNRAATLEREILGTTNIFVDISLQELLKEERALVSQQLLAVTYEANAARQAAEEANEAKSDFLTRMSHELRTPLNVIIGFSELLLEEMEELSLQALREDLSKIQMAGQHLLSLIDLVLDVSKLESGKMELQLANFDVFELISDITVLIQPFALQEGNTFQTVVKNALGSMYSDKLKIRQILFYILHNACKFTSHGQITLYAERLWYEGREWLKWDVEDTGIGIQQAHLDQIFEAFTQQDHLLTRRYEGMGLGLTMSKKLCDLLQGHMYVESTEGKGTRFTIYIPVHWEPPLE